MSGARQHFIPRFLQRGFADDPSSRNPMTVAYRKGRLPFRVATSNVGLERFFYSEDGDTSVDDSITAAEPTFSKLVMQLRSSSAWSGDPTQIGELLAHLENRTRHLRVTYADTATYLFDQILSRASDAEWFQAYANRAISENPSLLREALQQELSKRGLPIALLDSVMAASRPLIPQLMPSVARGISHAMAALIPGMPAKLSEAAKKGHLKSLARSLGSPVKAQTYAQLTYSIHTALVPIPLGDALTLVQVDGERRFKPFFEHGDRLVAIYLPLSGSKVLVGSDPSFAPPLRELPSAIVRSSVEVFIHPYDEPELRQLQSEIGTNAYLMSRAQLDEMLSEVFGDRP